MVLCSVALLPHGVMILDTSLQGLPQSSVTLHNACKQAAKSIVESKPDTILLLTPHGIALSDKIGIYVNEGIAGSAIWEGHWGNYCVQCDNNNSIVQELEKFLTEKQFIVERLSCFSSSSFAPLQWGEVVPLWFLDQYKTSVNLTVIVITFPLSRFDPVNYMPKAHMLGEYLGQFCTLSIENNFSIVISGDLSHVHPTQKDLLPIFLASPSLGTNAVIAQKFDKSIMNWAQSLMNNDIEIAGHILLSESLQDVVEAKTCGWSGICFIQGCLQYVTSVNKMKDLTPSTNAWDGQIYAYEVPTYYGMLVFTIIIKK